MALNRPLTPPRPANVPDPSGNAPAKHYAMYLTKSEQQILDIWCNAIWKAFQQPPYLVGSCLARPDFRDVDIRVVLPDDQVAAIHQVMQISQVNLAFSLYGQKMTGLPIDFQIQSRSECAKYDGQQRNPRGIGPGSCEPADKDADELLKALRK